MCQVSCVTCHLSPVTCHMSCVMCHLSHLRFFFLYFFYKKKIKKNKNIILYKYWKKWWSMSVEGLLQRGLPRLVFKVTYYYPRTEIWLNTIYINLNHRVSKSFNHAITQLRKIFDNMRKIWTSGQTCTNVMYFSHFDHIFLVSHVSFVIFNTFLCVKFSIRAYRLHDRVCF